MVKERTRRVDETPVTELAVFELFQNQGFEVATEWILADSSKSLRIRTRSPHGLATVDVNLTMVEDLEEHVNTADMPALELRGPNIPPNSECRAFSIVAASIRLAEAGRSCSRIIPKVHPPSGYLAIVRQWHRIGTEVSFELSDHLPLFEID